MPLASLLPAGGRGRGRGRGRGKAKAAPAPAAAVALQAKRFDTPYSVADLYAVAGEEASATAAVLDVHAFVKWEFASYEAEQQASLDTNPAEWWRNRAPLLGPHIALLARHCLGVPGSSADLERAFSHAGCAVTPKRASLIVEHAQALIFVHENMLKRVA